MGVRFPPPALYGAHVRSTPARGEVLVVLHPRPAAAPAPADGVEGTHHGAAVDGHPGTVRRAPEIRPARSMRGRAVRGDVRVLDRVQVDRPAVGVLRPAARPLDGAAVERRGVVGLDRRGSRSPRTRRREPFAGSGSAPHRGAAGPSPHPVRRRGGRRCVPCGYGRRSPSVARGRGAGRRGRRGSPDARRRPSSSRAATTGAAHRAAVLGGRGGRAAGGDNTEHQDEQRDDGNPHRGTVAPAMRTSRCPTEVGHRAAPIGQLDSPARESGWSDSNRRNLPAPNRALYQAELHPVERQCTAAVRTPARRRAFVGRELPLRARTRCRRSQTDRR